MESFLKNKIESSEDFKFNAFKKIYKVNKKSTLNIWLNTILFCAILFLFLPWTQNIRGKGKVTSLNQKDRAQQINTVISGKISKWYVKEGDIIRSGDTILKLEETKVDYLDPALLQRTQDQILAKEAAEDNYIKKATTGLSQLNAIEEMKDIKLKSIINKIAQQKSKIIADSAELKANLNEQSIYKRQIEAADLLLEKGAISQTEYEKRKANYQNSIAKNTVIANKILQGSQELINYELEKNQVIQDYIDKSSKVEGERFSALSDASSYASDIAKLRNVYASYDARNKLYYIIAPQDGQLGKLLKSGLGEVVKEGELIAEIIPISGVKAIEMFVDPMDLPLVSLGQNVMFVFDGFPAIMFSGWPNQSYGIFRGKVNSIESAISDNGKFRILVAEDPSYRPWPENLRLGNGANGIGLLKDVPIYYELWRYINGFPPDYYVMDNTKSNGKK